MSNEPTIDGLLAELNEACVQRDAALETVRQYTKTMHELEIDLAVHEDRLAELAAWAFSDTYITNPAMLPKIRSKAYMAYANGQQCATRVSSLYPGHSCSHGTTIGAHYPVQGKGTGTKVTDIAVGFSCQHCHDIIDGPDKKRRDFIIDKYPAAYADRLLKGLVETWTRLIMAGVIIIPDGGFK